MHGHVNVNLSRCTVNRTSIYHDARSAERQFITMHGQLNVNLSRCTVSWTSIYHDARSPERQFITKHGQLNGIFILKCFKIGYEGTDWINLAQDTKKSLIVAKSCMLWNAVNFFSSRSQWLRCTPSACLPPVRTAQHSCVQSDVYLELVTFWGRSAVRLTEVRSTILCSTRQSGRTYCTTPKGETQWRETGTPAVQQQHLRGHTDHPTSCYTDCQCHLSHIPVSVPYIMRSLRILIPHPILCGW